MQTRKWTDKDGQDRYSTEVVLARFRGEIIMLDSKLETEQGASGHAPPATQAATPGDLDDEIPFSPMRD